MVSPRTETFSFFCQWNPSNNWRTWKDVRIPDKRSPNVVFLLFFNVNVSIAAVVECCIKFDIDFRALQTPVIWRKVQVDLGNMDWEFRQNLVACVEEKQQSIKYFCAIPCLGFRKCPRIVWDLPEVEWVPHWNVNVDGSQDKEPILSFHQFQEHPKGERAKAEFEKERIFLEGKLRGFIQPPNKN